MALSVEENKKLKKISQNILSDLEKAGGYYIGSKFDRKKNRMMPSPSPYYISQRKLSLCETNGEKIFKMWDTTQMLYKKAILGEIEEPNLILQTIEGDITQAQREVQRLIARKQSTLPIFARADLTSFWHLAEVQERMGALGLFQNWLEAIKKNIPLEEGTEYIGKESLIDDIVKGIIESTQKEDPTVVLITPKNYLAEQKSLAKKLSSLGIITFVVEKDKLDNLKVKDGYIYYPVNRKKQVKVDFIYRREVNAAILANSNIGKNIIEASIENKVVCEPPLNMIYDTKSPLAFVKHPRLSKFFTNESEIVPETSFIPANKNLSFIYKGQNLNLEQILDLSVSKRLFVIKYSGPNIEYGFGGRGVFNVNDSRRSANRVLDIAIEQVKLGNPWIIQNYDKTRAHLIWLDKSNEVKETNKSASRWMVYYRREKNGKVNLFNIMGTNRPGDSWKASGSPKSVVQTVRFLPKS
ncbi:MAG: hypothetical protein Q9M91_04650 [Candidatus Dojkabacteria bacterium]|nr:hypothetical protein [Candidatus Dojkabacteria bacterium]MDQ7021101.1 hypothetical protein [Candidatus Dojkabacteria bacterium]